MGTFQERIKIQSRSVTKYVYDRTLAYASYGSTTEILNITRGGIAIENISRERGRANGGQIKSRMLWHRKNT